MRLEDDLHGYVAFFILPVFALFNAGVRIEGGFALILQPVSLGIMLGLLLGKQIGITLAAWLAVKSGWAVLPGGVNWRMVYGAGWLGAIGFTMSMFITELAFSDPLLVNEAKAGIITASLIAGVGGYLLLRFALPKEGT
jgi:NhaA family Na+:H+ antiporter